MMYGGSFPAVLKVGHAHAGMGKMRVADHHDWEDVRSVVAMTDGKYCTAEPFLTGDYDLRIQKIVRADTSSNGEGTTCVSRVFLCEDDALNRERICPQGSNFRAFKRTAMAGQWKVGPQTSGPRNPQSRCQPCCLSAVLL